MNVKAAEKNVRSLFELNDSGDLLYVQENSGSIKVTLSLCFPWKKTKELISIRDQQGEEVYLIHKLSDLDDSACHAVSKYLQTASFMMEILKINSIVEEFEIRNWNVITTQGKYIFQTLFDYWPERRNVDSLLIRDIAGNIFFVKDATSLDRHSQYLLWPYLD